MRSRLIQLSLTVALTGSFLFGAFYPLAFSDTSSQTAIPQAFSNTASGKSMTNDEFMAWFQSHQQSRSGNGDGIQLISISGADHPKTLTAKVEYDAYTLAPGDAIKIIVEGKPELSNDKVSVNLSGIVTLPLIGDVEFVGKSIVTIREELMERYQEYLVEPRILVGIKKMRPQTTYVLGAVAVPGSYTQASRTANLGGDGGDDGFVSIELSNPYDYRVTQAVMNAGGFAEDADWSHVKIYNEEFGYLKEVNLMDLILFGKKDQDIVLKINDIVYVPRLSDPFQMDREVFKILANSNMGQDKYNVRVYGLVRGSSVQNLKPQEMTLQHVLAKAGPVVGADRKRIIIARVKSDGTLEKMIVDSTQKDVPLNPNDIVLVTNTTTAEKIRRVGATVSSFLAPISSGLFTYNRYQNLDNNNN